MRRRRRGGLAYSAETLLAALTPAQRSAHAAREFRGLLDDTAGMKEIPA